MIGSSRIGASVLGGICNNPAVRWFAVARPTPSWHCMRRSMRRASCSWSIIWTSRWVIRPSRSCSACRPVTTADVGNGDGRAASDSRYAEEVQGRCRYPARFNADPSRHYEAAGSAGKLAVFAVRLDTFEKEAAEVFYIGSNRTGSLTAIRRQLLTGFERLPIAGEYIHRDAYDIGERYGKDSFLLIDRLGTSACPPRSR